MRYLIASFLFIIPLFTFAQSNLLDKLKNHLEVKAYDKAGKLIAEGLKQSKTDASINKGALWYYKGKVCSQMYFEKANSIDEDETAYKQRAYTLLAAIAAFQNACNKANDQYRDMSFRQLGGLHRFLKNIGLHYLESGNHERAYLNLRWARNCDKFVRNYLQLDHYQMDTMLIYLTIHTAELTNRSYESKSLYKELSLCGVTEEQMYIHHYMMLLGLGQNEEAVGMLQAGLLKYPASTGLSLYMLHHLAAENRYEELIQMVDEKLEILNGEHARLYFIKGMACNTLYDEMKGVYPQEAEEYFRLAESSFRKALDLKPTSFDYAYSLAALYYNKAILLDKDSNSSSQQKEYASMMERAEETLEISMLLRSDDANVIGALKDIYQRTNQTEKLDKLQKP